MYCPICGKEIPDDSLFCPDCGGATGGAVDEFSAVDVKAGKAAAIWAYFIPILFFIPLTSPKRRTPYGLRHANNALVLLIIDIAVSLIKRIFSSFMSGGMMTGINIILWVVSAGTLALAICGIVYACTGTRKELPIIGSWHLLDK